MIIDKGAGRNLIKLNIIEHVEINQTEILRLRRINNVTVYTLSHVTLNIFGQTECQIYFLY